MKTIILFVFAIVVFSNPIASFADEIKISTDKTSYGSDDCIVISGEVENPIPSEPLLIQVFGPNGNLLEIKQLEIENDGMFQAVMPTSHMWRYAGNYTIKAFYVGDNSQTMFQYGASVYAPSAHQILPLDNSTYFWIMNHRVENKTVSVEDRAISFTVPDKWNLCRSDDRILKIDFYRSITDTVQYDQETGKIMDGADKFLILVNGNVTEHDVVSYLKYSEISIPITWHSADVQIVIKRVIPEFELVLLIFGISMTAFVIFYRKSLLRNRV